MSTNGHYDVKILTDKVFIISSLEWETGDHIIKKRSKLIKLYKQFMFLLRKQITFIKAPAKKTCLSLFIFTHEKYIYLKRRINYSLTMVPIKNENERFWKEKLASTFMAVEV